MQRPAILYINSPNIGFGVNNPTLQGVHTIVDLRSATPAWQAQRVYKLQIPLGCPVKTFWERARILWNYQDITNFILEMRDSLLFRPDDAWCFICDCGSERCAFNVVTDLISLRDMTPNHKAFKRFVPFTTAKFTGQCVTTDTQDDSKTQGVLT